MAKRHIFIDKTELVLIYPQKKQYVSINLTYEQIVSIRFLKCREFILFIPVDSERIEIVSNKHDRPFIFTKLKEKGYFDSYKAELSEFAKRNKISFWSDGIEPCNGRKF